MRIAIAGEAPFELAPIRQAIRRAVRPYGLPRDATVQVAFVSDAEMRSLNKRFRRIDKTTDVLSFGETIPVRDRGVRAAVHIEARRAQNGGRFYLRGVRVRPTTARKTGRRAQQRGAEGGARFGAHGPRPP